MLVFGSGVQDGGSGAVLPFVDPKGDGWGSCCGLGVPTGSGSVKGLWNHSGLDLSSLWVIDWGSI